MLVFVMCVSVDKWNYVKLWRPAASKCLLWYSCICSHC